MAKEIELKLAVLQSLTDRAFESAIRSCVSSVMSGSSQTLRNIYFDTERHDLRRAKMALRIRQTESGWVQTLKTRGKQNHGVSERGEWEWPSRSGALNEGLLETVEAWQATHITQNLQPCFETTFRRVRLDVAYQGSKIECVFDKGRIFNDSGDFRPICEIELELKRGNVSVLKDLGFALSKRIACVPDSVSKAQRGYELSSQYREMSQRFETFVTTFRSEFDSLSQPLIEILAQFLIDMTFMPDDLGAVSNQTSLNFSLEKGNENSHLICNLGRVLRRFSEESALRKDSLMLSLCAELEQSLNRGCVMDTLRHPSWGRLLLSLT